MRLRPYQLQAVADISAAYRAGHQGVLAVLPTGAGKTVIFTDIAERCAAAGWRVCIILPRVELVRQTSRALTAQHGIIRAGVRPQPWLPIQVASAQTLCQPKRLAMYPQFDLLIVDEAHHATATTWMAITAAYPEARSLGVTATPVRTDGTGLGDAGYTQMVTGPTTAWLTDNGWLSPADVYTPGGMDTTGYKTKRGGDYSRKDLCAIAEKSRRTGDAVQHYRKLADGMPTIGFCVSVEDAEIHAEMFRAAGYQAAAIDGKMTDAARARLLSDLGNGGLTLLFSCDLISEGVDIPAVSCGILRRPTQSLALHRQQVGRCLRPAPGKSKAVILDHAGNTLKHGLPTDEIEWELSGVTRRGGDGDTGVTLRNCPECLRPHATAPICPRCGYVHPPTQREIEEVEGELELFAAKAASRAARVEEGSARTLEDLIALGKERGYNPGWAIRRWEYRESKRGAGVA